MNKLILLILCISSLVANEIPISHVQMQKFSPSLELNSKIVQLSNSKQTITSLVSGHISKYYVTQASKVKNGDKVALINSIDLSKMTAQFISLREQYKAKKDNFKSTKELYEKGMASKKDLNEQSIDKDAMLSRINSLESQLKALDIDTKKLSSASSEYILHAHIDGTVSQIIQPLHSSLSEHTPLLSIVNQDGFYLKSFVPLEYSQKVKLGQKILFKYGSSTVVTNISQILPELDKDTQRIVVLSLIPKNKQKFFINSYVASTIYFGKNSSYKSVEKTALSFFNNEWVVFVPKHEEEHRKADGHDGLDEHEEHEEDAEYEVKVIKIITQDENFVAIEGLDVGDEYVSAKNYFVKSLILKSSLGGHGH